MDPSLVFGVKARAARILRPQAGRACFAAILALVTSCASNDQPSRARARPPDAGTAAGGSVATGGSGGEGGSSDQAGQGGVETGGSPDDAATGGSTNPVSDAGADVPADANPVSGDCVADPSVPPSDGQCVTLGNPGYACNPVTSEPCNVVGGETCEFDGAGFTCQTLPSNPYLECLPCDVMLSASCLAGFTCRGSMARCTRYCCSDQDCGTGVHCTPQPPSTVGICQTSSGNALRDFGWNFPPPVDGGSDAGADAADAADDVPPPIDCTSCSAQFCSDRVQACSADSACAACLASASPADDCRMLSAWTVLLFCRCQSCADLCAGSCL
jgi:hypothetical protein